MATPKKYFHDHLVLLLLTINVFLALASCLFILLRLSTTHGSSYFVQYRSSLGSINDFKNGSVINILALMVFSLINLAASVMLSLGAYKIHRQLAIVILNLGILLLVLTIIVSNALLVLR